MLPWHLGRNCFGSVTVTLCFKCMLNVQIGDADAYVMFMTSTCLVCCHGAQLCMPLIMRAQGHGMRDHLHVLLRTMLGVVSAPWPWCRGSAKQRHEHEKVARRVRQVFFHMYVDTVWSHEIIERTANACVFPLLLSTHRSMQQQVSHKSAHDWKSCHALIWRVFPGCFGLLVMLFTTGSLQSR